MDGIFSVIDIKCKNEMLNSKMQYVVKIHPYSEEINPCSENIIPNGNSKISKTNNILIKFFIALFLSATIKSNKASMQILSQFF
jgi:hypothetical protein